MVDKRGHVVEGYHFLTACFTTLPTMIVTYIAIAPHFRNF